MLAFITVAAAATPASIFQAAATAEDCIDHVTNLGNTSIRRRPQLHQTHSIMTARQVIVIVNTVVICMEAAMGQGGDRKRRRRGGDAPCCLVFLGDIRRGVISSML